ncbi:DUF2589 domain-containing protein [Elizabethkingia bruuniana]|uniref:DUF2589 domain-containing protein n=1 Tax=Elizabethkingia bruuniana TaxID=1756149 RepID=A0A7T7ZY39_9FLAO|nr:DUF2589 domain-containing protein [Elizabethkingia bruuniana]AQX85741.1 hypothetical protein AYC65_12315 [Elizabethkingia bruuniana]KUY22842.1 hypothetical protein ATB97_11660 [Elizabethkingia bruuniana]OPB68713.1 hypothetical protein BAY12_00770 [Elizabethkingia bruuniana]QDZ61908.1 DUF2589 domain-containing protein [Elizabethkingia bruuniana]QQN59411.1 DUF2589 domain-containing protein [Elizabethkingia bruuniana]
MSDPEEYKHNAALIEDLLAAPFIAAANANSKMAQEQVKFLIETCFETHEDSFIPKMVNLIIKKNNPSEDDYLPVETINVGLPLITILPFNSLCVKDINVKFEMEVTSLTPSNNTNETGNEKKMQMRGSISSSKEESNSIQRRNQSKIAVEITGGSIPLPIGLTTLLNFYSHNIHLKS